MNHPIMFLDEDNRTKLVPASRKINFSVKSVIVITVIISLHYKETN